MGFFRKKGSKPKENPPEIQCHPLKPRPTKRGNEVAIVACGCFWNPQGRFLKMEGVVRVVAGYTGGVQPYPCREDLKDHTEALMIEYDPRVVSYRQILEMWHDNDYPWEPERLEQRSALFVISIKQQEQALAYLHYLRSTRPNCHLYVDLEPARIFYQAEDSQQNYIAKQYKAAKDKMVAWANNETKSGLFAIVE